MKTTNAVKPNVLMLGGLLLVGAGFASPSQAACSFNSGSSEQTYSFDFGTLTVQRDTPAGTVLVTRTMPERSFNLGVSCTSGITPYVYNELRFSTLSSFGNKVYNTNIEGIGIRLFLGSAPGSSSFPFSGTLAPLPASLWIGGGSGAQLVRTASANVGAGAITTGTLARGFLNASPRLYYNTFRLTGGTIRRAACTVTNTSIPVPLGDRSRTDFTGPGSTSQSVPFSIPLSCDPNTRVRVTLDGTPVPSGAQGVVALSPSTETVATGVGVQILRNNTPVTLGTSIAIGTSGGGVYNIPLVGRYYQTQPNVTAGKANATATFTMTYN